MRDSTDIDCGNNYGCCAENFECEVFCLVRPFHTDRNTAQ